MERDDETPAAERYWESYWRSSNTPEAGRRYIVTGRIVGIPFRVIRGTAGDRGQRAGQTGPVGTWSSVSFRDYANAVAERDRLNREGLEDFAPYRVIVDPYMLGSSA